MESVVIDGSGDDLFSEDNYGSIVRKSILYGSDDVGGIGVGSDEDDIRFVGCMGVIFGYVVGILFMFGKDEVEVF